jgi:8-oxo-dGTP diphosphatase
MSKKYHTCTPASYLILIHEKKALLIRRFNTGYEDGNYSLPAGHVEPGERPTLCALREAEEEIGVSVREEDAHLVHTMYRKAEDDRVDFFFTTEKYSGVPQNKEPHKCDHMDWFPLDALPANTIPYIKTALEAYQKGEHFSEFGWN